MGVCKWAIIERMLSVDFERHCVIVCVGECFLCAKIWLKKKTLEWHVTAHVWQVFLVSGDIFLTI